MSVMQLLDNAMGLEHHHLVAIADAVQDSRSAQGDEVEELRARAVRALALDQALMQRFGQVQHDMAGLAIVGPDWPHAQVCEALADAALAMLASPAMSREERAVLEWPWVSVCGPLPAAA